MPNSARDLDSQSLASMKAVLSSVNWSFSTPFSVGRSGLGLFDARKYHWYPATFIPEIPYTLMEVLASPESIIFDPFMGIGTTLYQALELGHTPYGNDISRVSIQCFRSIWTLLRPSLNIERLLINMEELFASYTPTMAYERELIHTTVRVEQLQPWYNADTFRRLAFLMVSERRCKNLPVRAALRVALSAALKAVCAQDKGWGCIADNVLPKPAQLEVARDPIPRVRQNVYSLLRGISAFRQRLPAHSNELLSAYSAQSFILHRDVREESLAMDGKVDLVITSPPYPNMTDYTTSQRLSYYWLGGDPSDDIKTEIGARRRRFSSESIVEYDKAMNSVVDVIKTKLKPSGYVCLVLPSFNVDQHNNVVRRQSILRLLSYVEDSGFTRTQQLNRLLPERRRHHNQGWTSLEKETISIFRKQ